MPFSETKSCDEAINRLADSVATPAKDSVISRRGNGELGASGWKYLAFAEFGKHGLERALVGNALQYLTKNNISHAETLTLKFSVQPLHLRIADPSKIINPNRGINDDHLDYSRPRP